MKKKLLLYCIFCLCCLQTFSQLSITDFTKFTFKEGLTDNTITDIVQDDLGYMWIGTEQGLNRFDGKEFKTFYRKDKTINLPSNNIFHLKNLGSNELAILTKQGLQLLNIKTFSSKNYLLPDTTFFTEYLNSTWDACLLPNNKIALSTVTGFYIFNREGSIYFRYDRYFAKDARKKIIRYGRSIFKLSNSEYILHTDDDGYGVYNLNANTFLHIDWSTKNPYPMFRGRIISKNEIGDAEFLMLQYTTDTIVYYQHKQNKTTYSKMPFIVYSNIDWYAKIKKYNDSIYLLNAGTGFYLLAINKITGKVTAQKESILKELKPYCHFTDKEGRLWIGTSNGLYMQKLQKLPIQKVPIAHKSQQHSVKTAKYYKGKIYLGNMAKYDSGLWIMNATTKAVEKKIMFYESSSDWNEIFCIEQYQPDTLWIGSAEGILWFSTLTHNYGKVVLSKTNNELLHERFPFLVKNNEDKNPWIFYSGTPLFGNYNIPSKKFIINYVENREANSNITIKHLVTDSYGNVWIAGEGLARFNTTTNKIDTTIIQFAGHAKHNTDVLTISADNNGSLWLQTATNDFLEYKIKDKKFVVYNEALGFPAGEVIALSKVINNKMWIHQSNRLLLFDTKFKSYQIFSTKDGLPEDKVTCRNIIYSPEMNEYYSFYSKHLAILQLPLLNNSIIRKINIYQIKLSNQQNIFNPDSIVKISYKESDVVLYFSTQDFEYGDEYIYHYKINNGNWIFINNTNELHLGKLESGNHSITLKTNNKAGVEIVQTIHIKVTPPFWKKGWFLLLIVLTFLLLMYYFHKQRERKIKAALDIDKKITEYEMKALHAQMNPHFIFNALNSIKDLILKKDNDKASRYLSKFSQLTRINLEQSNKSFIPLEKIILQINQYLEIEALRFDDFIYSVSIANEIDTSEIMAPPMLLQPLVENAIWHGLLPKTGTKKLSINFINEGDLICCVIEDNGIGIIKSTQLKVMSNHLSIGLQNIKQRIKIINEKYNTKYALSITDKQNEYSYDETGTISKLWFSTHIKNIDL